ncbi:MAG TPA: DNA helicase RecQ [Treponema sp.]|nr:DNA helicase RecQ [Treponema sp.]
MNKFEILKSRFGYSGFRPGQEEVIDALVSGRDALAVMPTGAGKSLCYQIPALLLPGLTVVISPLISLMKDQVNALREAGCPAAFLNSSQSADEYGDVVSAVMDGRVKLLYIAPERLQRARVFASVGIPLVVIDEAHCVSQWGHDFRTSYLEIADFIKSVKPRPVTAAFTATATPKVRDDIRGLLALRDPFIANTGFDRPNLYFEVQKPRDKKAALLEYLAKRKNSSGIIYCATRKNVEEICALLAAEGFSATRYHAGLDDGERRINQDDFIYDRKTVMVATNAFGMGIDKSNVAFVIHFNMPKNIESYYQEAGRAGRDGSPAECVLLYSGQDVRINEFLITRSAEDDEETEADVDARAHNLELLKQMTFYATSRDCLRRRLLGYFGDDAPAACGHCSNCLAEYEETDVTVDARRIVSCVYSLKQRGRSFGKTMIIDILRGSSNEKIRRSALHTLAEWGLLSGVDAQRVRAILDGLIEERYLRLDDGEYPVVTLGRAGELMDSGGRFLLKMPVLAQPGGTAQQRRRGMAAGTDAVFARERKAGETAPSAGQGEIDQLLFEKLRKLRSGLAASEAVPAYIVFPDATLRDMCRKKPVSLEEFSGVTGVGQVKLEKYGDVFTALIREYCSGE